MDGIDTWRAERIANAHADIEWWTKAMADNDGNQSAIELCQQEIDRANRMLAYMEMK